MSRLLIIEDDRNFAEGLRYNLDRAGHDVETAFTGDDGLALAERGGYELILLDLMLPGVDGLGVLRALRASGDDTPIIIVSARDRDLDKVRGFDHGADDYLSKPFGMGELLARIRARLRGEERAPAGFKLGPRTIHLERLLVIDGDRETRLTPTEARLLGVLHRRRNAPVERHRLLRDVWGAGQARTRTLDTHVTRLRRKVETDPAAPKHLITVHGVGYRLVVTGDD